MNDVELRKNLLLLMRAQRALLVGAEGLWGHLLRDLDKGIARLDNDLHPPPLPREKLEGW